MNIHRHAERISNQTRKIFFVLLFSAFQIMAQPPRIVIPEDTPVDVPAESNTWWYVLIFLLIAGLAGAVIWMLKSRSTAKAVENEKKSKRADQQAKDSDSLDFDKEIEWFRKNKKLVDRKKNPAAQSLPRPGEVLNRKFSAENAPNAKSEPSAEPEKMPIFNIERWEAARPFEQLAISSDASLLNAVEQIQDEFEEDEMVRELAVKVLAAFETSNSVESLTQVALYDLSSNLRSQAVGILAGFDHESVFEGILLACADPTREVRAAGARGLFQLNFDRADAWTRIAESGDDFRMRQAARAAIEAGLVERYFDRLIHQDSKYAYEAFTFIALLLRSGETEQITAALVNHPNMNVRRAILHVIKISSEPNGLTSLYDLTDDANLPEDFRQEINHLVESNNLVTA